MPTPPLPDEVLRAMVEAVEHAGNVCAAARELDISRETLVGRLRTAERRGIKPKASRQPPPFETASLPSSDVPIENLIAAKQDRFERQRVAREARALVPVRVNIEGAYGILMTGDPHLDDDGCDWSTLQNHIDLCNKTEGMFAANVGDITNSWVGRLARLYANQSTTATESVRLIEWFVKALPWLYIIHGNHDCWNGANSPLKWFADQAHVTNEAHGLRLGLTQPNGKTLRVNARHDFRGASMWNSTHALTKAAKFAWERDDIYVCGHRHSAGYASMIMQNGAHVAHAIRLGAYKVFDDYADAAGFSPENMPAALTIINTEAKTPSGKVTFFWDVYEGADYLRFLRRPRIRVKAIS
jgi:UDP-2,3-diacylglucosamine pyrophosphatase LpxH/transposase-like protein